MFFRSARADLGHQSGFDDPYRVCDKGRASPGGNRGERPRKPLVLYTFNVVSYGGVSGLGSY